MQNFTFFETHAKWPISNNVFGPNNWNSWETAKNLKIKIRLRISIINCRPFVCWYLITVKIDRPYCTLYTSTPYTRNLWSTNKKRTFVTFKKIVCMLKYCVTYKDRKKSRKMEISMNIYSWGGVKPIYRWNNDIWVSLHPMRKYLLKYQFSPIFF